MQLHISADASQYAYRAVVYIRYLHHDFIHCSFVVGKCRLAPTQEINEYSTIRTANSCNRSTSKRQLHRRTKDEG